METGVYVFESSIYKICSQVELLSIASIYLFKLMFYVFFLRVGF